VKEKTVDSYENISRNSGYFRKVNIEVRCNPYFWDCLCEKNYIHSKIENECAVCGAKRENMPFSLADEVQKKFYVDLK
jgi:hypothetical protein